MSKILGAWLLALFTTTATAQEWHLLDLNEFAFEAYDIKNHRDGYFGYDLPDSEHWTNGYAAVFDADLLKLGNTGLYWNNRVHGEATTSQVRQVGWQYELGIDVADKLELYWAHHSQHVLDDDRVARYPLDNFFGCRFVLYRRNK